MIKTNHGCLTRSVTHPKSISQAGYSNHHLWTRSKNLPNPGIVMDSGVRSRHISLSPSLPMLHGRNSLYPDGSYGIHSEMFHFAGIGSGRSTSSAFSWLRSQGLLGHSRAGWEFRERRFHPEGIKEMESSPSGIPGIPDLAFKNKFCNSNFHYFLGAFFPKNSVQLLWFLPWFLFLRLRSQISPIRNVLHSHQIQPHGECSAFPSNPTPSGMFCIPIKSNPIRNVLHLLIPIKSSPIGNVLHSHQIQPHRECSASPHSHQIQPHRECPVFPSNPTPLGMFCIPIKSSPIGNVLHSHQIQPHWECSVFPSNPAPSGMFCISSFPSNPAPSGMFCIPIKSSPIGNVLHSHQIQPHWECSAFPSNPTPSGMFCISSFPSNPAPSGMFCISSFPSNPAPSGMFCIPIKSSPTGNVLYSHQIQPHRECSASPHSHQIQPHRECSASPRSHQIHSVFKIFGGILDFKIPEGDSRHLPDFLPMDRGSQMIPSWLSEAGGVLPTSGSQTSQISFSHRTFVISNHPAVRSCQNLAARHRGCENSNLKSPGSIPAGKKRGKKPPKCQLAFGIKTRRILGVDLSQGSNKQQDGGWAQPGFEGGFLGSSFRDPAAPGGCCGGSRSWNTQLSHPWLQSLQECRSR
ncbi:uncharacterized protein LOC111927347 isoform X1 [Cyanistes caeruleus]|uniref:uncharacterized protein LOC111927347 isoform X1 n=1 Tax=Cyanistes caeruleus TaxID=156563 RepID=UPI000CDB6B35|nr:uncharacterized protein LOC111927347 isoform X1 [Cyanistes caeruleus]